MEDRYDDIYSLTTLENLSEVEAVKQVPRIINSTFDNLRIIKAKIDEASIKAKNAEDRAKDAADIPVGFFRRTTPALEALQRAATYESEAIISVNDCQKLLFDQQAILAKCTSLLFMLCCEDLGRTRVAVKEVTMCMQGASQEKISVEAKQEMYKFLQQLKQQMDILERQDKMERRIKELSGRIDNLQSLLPPKKARMTTGRIDNLQRLPPPKKARMFTGKGIFLLLLFSLISVFLLISICGGVYFFFYRQSDAIKQGNILSQLDVLKAQLQGKNFLSKEEIPLEQRDTSQATISQIQTESNPETINETTSSKQIETFTSPDKTAAYVLRERMHTCHEKIIQANYAATDGFEKYLNLFTENYNAGNSAMTNNDYPLAAQFYTEAEKASDWLITNAPLREKASELRKRTEQVAHEALMCHADQFSSSQYKTAQDYEAKAGELYSNAQFDSSIQKWEEATQLYVESKKISLNEQKKRLESDIADSETRSDWTHLKELGEKMLAIDEARGHEVIEKSSKGLLEFTYKKEISEAEHFAANNDWKKVLSCVNKALELKPDDPKSLKLKSKAKTQLIPITQIETVLNGIEVPGTINFGLDTESYSSGSKVQWEEEGKQLEITGKYMDNTGLYAGKANINTTSGFNVYKIELELADSWEFKIDEIALNMVYVEPGTFMMGNDKITKQAPQHTVRLTKGYWIGKYEVTQKQYEKVMGKNPSYRQKSREFTLYNNPVEHVRWAEAQEFCEKLNTLLSSQLPAGYSFRLPTEAEWEYAARGGKKSKGFQFCGSNDVYSVAWFDKNGERNHHPVGVKNPNELGIYDMSGNVEEWCLDDYDNYPKGAGAITDPLCKSGKKNPHHVVRGGSYSSTTQDTEITWRDFRSSPNFDIGFRLVLSTAN